MYIRVAIDIWGWWSVIPGTFPRDGNIFRVRWDPPWIIANIHSPHDVENSENCLDSSLKWYILLEYSLEKDCPCITSWPNRLPKVTVLLSLYEGKVPQPPLPLTHYLFSFHPIRKKSFDHGPSGNSGKANETITILFPTDRGQWYSFPLASWPQPETDLTEFSACTTFHQHWSRYWGSEWWLRGVLRN